MAVVSPDCITRGVAGFARSPIQGTFSANSGNIQGAFRAHSGNHQVTFSAHSGNLFRCAISVKPRCCRRGDVATCLLTFVSSGLRVYGSAGVWVCGSTQARQEALADLVGAPSRGSDG
jgi:hypothetical protein